MKLSRLPTGTGLGFKPEHYEAIIAQRPGLNFLEVHAENYMGDGGASLKMLEHLRQDYALSVHGVALSIGGDAPLDIDHLGRLKRLCDRFEPQSFSEHLAWSTHDNAFLNDLLPLPYTEATLVRVCAHIDQAQTFLQRQILLENPATYLVFPESTWSEVDFIETVVRRTGCGLLLDVNNVHVSAINHGFSALDHLARFPLHHVYEIHLAGHAIEEQDGDVLLIDTHDRPVDADVWAWFSHIIMRTGPIPTLVEWDQDLPPFETLLAEADKAAMMMADIERRYVA